MLRLNEIASDWSELVARWYAGTPPDLSPDCVWRALQAVERHWPEGLDALAGRKTRAPAFMARTVDVGSSLLACETLKGFDRVLHRLRAGEVAAESELECAAAFVSLGYCPELEPELHGRRLDFAIDCAGFPIYVEVVSPQMSTSQKDTYDKVQSLADRLYLLRSGLSFDIVLLSDVTDAVAAQLSSFISSTQSERSGYQEISGIGHVRWKPYDRHLPPYEPPSAQLKDVPVIGVSRGRASPTTGSFVSLFLPFTDSRAQSVMEGESKHFSRDHCNILIMKIGGIGSHATWTPLIQRRFQPTLNQRFGAVILIDSVTSANRLVRDWRPVPNPFALRPVPSRVMEQLVTLNLPQFPTGQRLMGVNVTAL